MLTFIEGAMNWVINQMARAIEAKKDNIERRRARAIVSYEPKIIWISMMDRLNGSSRTLAFGRIFNDALKSILAG